MKRLLLPLLLSPILLASCSSNKYSSFIEAETACEKWQADRYKIVVGDYTDNPEWYVRRNQVFGNSFFSKQCEHDKETRQILGWKFTTKYISPGKRKDNEKAWKHREIIKERFYY